MFTVNWVESNRGDDVNDVELSHKRVGWSRLEYYGVRQLRTTLLSSGVSLDGCFPLFLSSVVLVIGLLWREGVTVVGSLAGFREVKGQQTNPPVPFHHSNYSTSRHSNSFT